MAQVLERQWRLCCSLASTVNLLSILPGIGQCASSSPTARFSANGSTQSGRIASSSILRFPKNYTVCVRRMWPSPTVRLKIRTMEKWACHRQNICRISLAPLLKQLGKRCLRAMTPEDEGVTAEDEAVTPAFKRYFSFKLFYKRSALGLRLRLEETSHRLLSRQVERQS